MLSLLLSAGNHDDEFSYKEPDELLQNPIRFEIFFPTSSPLKYSISCCNSAMT